MTSNLRHPAQTKSKEYLLVRSSWCQQWNSIRAWHPSFHTSCTVCHDLDRKQSLIHLKLHVFLCTSSTTNWHLHIACSSIDNLVKPWWNLCQILSQIENSTSLSQFPEVEVIIKTVPFFPGRFPAIEVYCFSIGCLLCSMTLPPTLVQFYLWIIETTRKYPHYRDMFLMYLFKSEQKLKCTYSSQWEKQRLSNLSLLYKKIEAEY